MTPNGRAVQERLQALEAQVNRLGMEKAILKKASTFLAEVVLLDMHPSDQLQMGYSYHGGVRRVGYTTDELLCLAKTAEECVAGGP